MLEQWRVFVWKGREDRKSTLTIPYHQMGVVTSEMDTVSVHVLIKLSSSTLKGLPLASVNFDKRAACFSVLTRTTLGLAHKETFPT